MNKFNVKNILSILILNFFGTFCFGNFINAEQIKISNYENKYSLKTSYLETKGELDDYILDTDDILSIRFENRPKGIDNYKFEKEKLKDISYLIPRNNLDNYILGPGDVLLIKFKKTPELNNEYRIDKTGQVLMPRIKNAYVSGLTIKELTDILEKRYEEFLISPIIEIIISEYKFIGSGTFRINEEGEIYLPALSTDPNETLRKTFIRGLTTDELELLLEERYQNFLINPKVFVQITSFKPLRVSTNGEVRNPGILKFEAFRKFQVKGSQSELKKSVLSRNKNQKNSLDFNIPDYSNNENKNNFIRGTETSESKSLQSFSNNDNNISIGNDSDIKSKSNYLSTLSRAIFESGGLTSYSDISQIKVIRDIPLGKGGGKKVAIIDLNSLIYESDDTNDIRLFDGDQIFIPRLKERNSKLIPLSIISGLTPKFINIQIAGKIENQGIFRIPIEGSLSDVMNLSGPRKPLSGKVFLIRYGRDGSLLRKQISYSSRSVPGSKSNPFLQEGDIISVKNSILGSSASTIKTLTEPFIGVYTLKELIKNF